MPDKSETELVIDNSLSWYLKSGVASNIQVLPSLVSTRPREVAYLASTSTTCVQCGLNVNSFGGLKDYISHLQRIISQT